MPFDLTGRSLVPLSELISQEEFPLSEFLPLDQVANLFTGLYVVEHSLNFESENLVIDGYIAFQEELSFHLPGADSYALVLGSAGPGWTAIRATITVGPDLSLLLTDVTLGLRFDPAVLRDRATGNPAELELACTIKISPEGIEVSDYAGLSLSPAALCGTEIVVEADALTLVFGEAARPAFLADQEAFQGLAFDRLHVSIPSEYLALDPGSSLAIAIENGAIGSTGFTGKTRLEADPAAPITGKFLGFTFRFRTFSIDVSENAIVEAGLGIDLRLEVLEQGGAPKWIALDVAFDAGGNFSAAAAAVQPDGTSSDPAALVTLDYPGAIQLALDSFRLAKRTDPGGAVWAVYFSGSLQILIPGATWPKVGFDELGVDSRGNLLLPEGGGIVFAAPLVVEWYFVKLSVPKFRFGRPENDDQRLQVQLSAEVNLIDGLPAGASVEGLTVTWDPGAAAPPEVSFTGIGIEFGVPGCFNAGIEVSFIQEAGSVEFRGQGHMELSALDMRVEIGVIIGYDVAQNFAFLYLFADAKLLPTGIPIAQTGLSIYGFQGLIANNMALAIDPALTEDERYYSLFSLPPIGITDISKWRKQKGQDALGIGVVLGTADKGFAFNVKGLFVVAFPDLTLLLQAKANVLALKPDLSTQSEGTFDALLVYASGQNTLTFDLDATWGILPIVEVSGSARAFFDFDDPLAFYLRIGQDADTKRVEAKVIRWGDKWLFTAGYWFELNRHGIINGCLIDVGVRYEKGGFWIEAIGRARGELALFWEPPQWEGDVALEGRIGVGYRGISIGIGLGGSARVRVARPFDVRLSVEACIRALFWKICKGHTFKWERLDPPDLSIPLRAISAKPRDWTLKVGEMPSPGGTGGAASADTGAVQLVSGDANAAVQPHSVIAVDFAKPMVDTTGRFNEAVVLPDSGFLTIGEDSGWAAAYELLDVRLVRDPSGEAHPVDLWGTWAQETPQYNSTLRLLSSERFAHDGSLTEVFVEGTGLDYCAAPENREVCLPLAGIEPGFGWIAGRFPYHWDTSKSQASLEDRRNDPFVELLPGDRLVIFLPKALSDAHFVARECPRRPSGDAERDDDRVRVVLEEPGGVGPPGAGARVGPGADVSTQPVLRRAVPNRDERGQLVIVAEQSLCLVQLCFRPGHSPSEYDTLVRRGRIVTTAEAWTVPEEARILRPGATYALEVDYKAKLRDPDGSISEPVTARGAWRAEFQVAGPPVYTGALTNYIAATYPSRGARPVYTDYDFVVKFRQDYVPFLYSAAKQELLIRLFDGQGNPVMNAAGEPVLLPARRIGAPARTLTQRYWEEQYQINVKKGCIKSVAPIHEGETTLNLLAPDFRLTPDSQYLAELVASGQQGTPLFSWSFTTSRFSTFTQLVTSQRRVEPSRQTMGPATDPDFEGLARRLGVPTVSYVDSMTATPFVSLDRSRCLAILVEAPEPLDASSRLRAMVDGVGVDILTNLDQTRLFLRRPGGVDWPSGRHLIRLSWSRGDIGDPAETLRSLGGVLGDEVVEFPLSSGTP